MEHFVTKSQGLEALLSTIDRHFYFGAIVQMTKVTYETYVLVH